MSENKRSVLDMMKHIEELDEQCSGLSPEALIYQSCIDAGYTDEQAFMEIAEMQRDAELARRVKD